MMNHLWNIRSEAMNRNNLIDDIGNWSSNFDWFSPASAAKQFYLHGIFDHITRYMVSHKTFYDFHS